MLGTHGGSDESATAADMGAELLEAALQGLPIGGKFGSPVWRLVVDRGVNGVRNR